MVETSVQILNERSQCEKVETSVQILNERSQCEKATFYVIPTVYSRKDKTTETVKRISRYQGLGKEGE